jgi:hypothetical protein
MPTKATNKWRCGRKYAVRCGLTAAMELGFLEEGLLDAEVWYLTLSTAFG